MKCCGLKKGPEDWEGSKWYKDLSKKSGHTKAKVPKVPQSCCVKKSDKCNIGTVKELKLSNKIFKKVKLNLLFQVPNACLEFVLKKNIKL